MTAAPEFSRPVRLDQVGAGESTLAISAEPAERAALARRFDLIAIDRLEAQFRLRRDAIGILASGSVTGDVVQACVATGAPVSDTIDEPFLIRFLPETEAGDADEIELSDDDCDTVFYAGGAIDLGEAAAETLALALDPYPRVPDADAQLRAAGVLREEEAGPFGPLAGLRDKLAGRRGD
ncbi:YceD family protein [Sphingomonas sp. CCH15-F11]|uniref:YceD family protein n=2 Tax=unclassified Sphingomonas TaxID=196159 RepID=UPI000831E046|nr:YceD family protein [Sphingomonas sp. CCH15-F11]